ncbi:LamB/YcsF family protein [Virgibacillus sp. DJP39]|uniref:LamB/YcsF family protein n=1 Tax=Virgibacillus sp. DJP39 TaxID=3409790 RepID=UPI003BB78B93
MEGARLSKTIDINCDLGEGFGVYTFGADESLMQYISSANIACGAHAGDPNVMDAVVRLAKKYGVAVGAHPGFPDLPGFGRRNMQLSPDEIFHIVVYQVGALAAFCKVHEIKMNHVKPHGALYNLAAKDSQIAEVIAGAIYAVNSDLILYGLAGSELIPAGEKAGLKVASEIFADRTYQPDGSLTLRKEPHAMITEINKAVNQVKTVIESGYVEAVDGTKVKLRADTVCIHGDGEQAVNFAKELRTGLNEEGVSIKPLS